MAGKTTMSSEHNKMVIPSELSELLHLQETPTHYAVRTLSGATLIRTKTVIHYPWQLLEGILDDGKNTSEERRFERERELSHDEAKFGTR